MRKDAYNLQEPDRSWYKALTATAKRRLGMPDYVAWNVAREVRRRSKLEEEGELAGSLCVLWYVRQVLTCYEVHGKPFPPGVDEPFYRDILRFCGLLWGQW